MGGSKSKDKVERKQLTKATEAEWLESMIACGKAFAKISETMTAAQRGIKKHQYTREKFPGIWWDLERGMDDIVIAIEDLTWDNTDFPHESEDDDIVHTCVPKGSSGKVTTVKGDLEKGEDIRIHWEVCLSQTKTVYVTTRHRNIRRGKEPKSFWKNHYKTLTIVNKDSWKDVPASSKVTASKDLISVGSEGEFLIPAGSIGITLNEITERSTTFRIRWLRQFNQHKVQTLCRTEYFNPVSKHAGLRSDENVVYNTVEGIIPSQTMVTIATPAVL